MTELFVIRHATPEDGDFPNRERPLGELGRRQADGLAEWLAGKGIDAVYTSPFRRAMETVEPFCRTADLQAQVLENLRESTKYELLPEVRTRMVETVQHIVDANPGERVVVCTHGGTLWGLISHLDPEFGYDQYRQLGTPDVKRFVLDGDSARYDPEFRAGV
jgi:2,3-bisphosphoglycerate-dependent phosphoglycerate mutase